MASRSSSYASTSISASASASAENCTICFEELAEQGERTLVTLKCFHKFHLDCIGSAFNCKGAMICPNCREVEKGEWIIFPKECCAGFSVNGEPIEELDDPELEMEYPNEIVCPHNGLSMQIPTAGWYQGETSAASGYRSSGLPMPNEILGNQFLQGFAQHHPHSANQFIPVSMHGHMSGVNQTPIYRSTSRTAEINFTGQFGDPFIHNHGQPQNFHAPTSSDHQGRHAALIHYSSREMRLFNHSPSPMGGASMLGSMGRSNENFNFPISSDHQGHHSSQEMQLFSHSQSPMDGTSMLASIGRSNENFHAPISSAHQGRHVPTCYSTGEGQLFSNSPSMLANIGRPNGSFHAPVSSAHEGHHAPAYSSTREIQLFRNVPTGSDHQGCHALIHYSSREMHLFNHSPSPMEGISMLASMERSNEPSDLRRMTLSIPEGQTSNFFPISSVSSAMETNLQIASPAPASHHHQDFQFLGIHSDNDREDSF